MSGATLDAFSASHRARECRAHTATMTKGPDDNAGPHQEGVGPDPAQQPPWTDGRFAARHLGREFQSHVSRARTRLDSEFGEPLISANRRFGYVVVWNVAKGDGPPARLSQLCR